MARSRCKESHSTAPNMASGQASPDSLPPLARCLGTSTCAPGRKYKIACGTLQANGKMAMEPILDTTEVAEAVVHMAVLPLSTSLQFAITMATKMWFV